MHVLFFGITARRRSARATLTILLAALLLAGCGEDHEVTVNWMDDSSASIFLDVYNLPAQPDESSPAQPESIGQSPLYGGGPGPTWKAFPNEIRLVAGLTDDDSGVRRLEIRVATLQRCLQPGEPEPDWMAQTGWQRAETVVVAERNPLPTENPALATRELNTSMTVSGATFVDFGRCSPGEIPFRAAEVRAVGQNTVQLFSVSYGVTLTFHQ